MEVQVAEKAAPAKRNRNIKVRSTVATFSPVTFEEYVAASPAERMALEVGVATFAESRRAKLAKDQASLKAAQEAIGGPVTPNENETLAQAILRVNSAPAYYTAKVDQDALQVIEADTNLREIQTWK